MRLTPRMVAAGTVTLLAGCQPNLQWEEPKSYAPPPAETLAVAGFGIDDTVMVFPPGTASITVSHGVANKGGRGSAGAGWVALDTITRWIFQGSPTGGYGWVKGPAATHTAGVLTGAGIALGNGATGTITFPPFTVPNTCGLYGETLRLDTGGTIGETNENDNVDTTSHFFFIPSPTRIGINVVDVDPSFSHAPPVPHVTHNFVVTVSPGGTPPGAIFAGFSYTALEGSTVTVAPAPPVAIAPGAPLVIAMTVTPQNHTSVSASVTGKVTVISADGCVVRQQSARAFVEHR